MKAFPTYSVDTAPEAAKPALQQSLAQLGFVPNMYAHLAAAPIVLDAYRYLMDLFEQTSLNPVERQVVLLTVSVENCCRFCVPAQSFIAKHTVGVPEAIVASIREQSSIDDQHLEALRQTTLQLMHNRGYLSEESLADFVAAGFNSSQALEVLLGISLKMLSNFSNHLMGTEPQIEFNEEAWEPVEKS